MEKGIEALAEFLKEMDTFTPQNNAILLLDPFEFILSPYVTPLIIHHYTHILFTCQP
ncbi:hypothetical protein PISMIDRAFT_6540 [Pisolithus microcarpus 441]|uniref:Uncharacterized protein n=1 Tax=Pisolithus microcarpus 441 TaxID=765257 RepID=A0A0C9ZKA6_9AGAM|nr:hypothetical protein PISMIDRAFT_6540 [Pisolithus microcarpus 441]